MSAGRSRIDRAVERLATVQGRRPCAVLLAAAFLLALALGPASRIELRTDLTALLSSTDPAVVELQRVLGAVEVASKLYVVLETETPRAARGCGDALAGRIRALGAPAVTSAETGIHAGRAFLLPRALLFAPVEELERARAAIAARRDRAVVSALVGDLDDEPPEGVELGGLRDRIAAAQGFSTRMPDGYFEARDGRALVVVVTSALAPGDLVGAGAALEAVRRTVREELGSSTCDGVRAGFAGDLATAFDSYRIVRDDLLGVGALGVGLVLGVILLFFFRIRALVALGVALLVGLAWTFGLASLAIGHLNVATGFLVSVVAGNGLNGGIILADRTFEEARAGVPLPVAVVTASTTTWRATLGAAVASGAAYGALALTGFRALAEFAFIGAAGIIACWAATYLVLPPILVIYDACHPFAAASVATTIGRLRARGLPFGRPLAALVRRAPRRLALVGTTVLTLGIGLGARHAAHGLVEHDLRRVRSDLVLDPDRARLVARAAEVVGSAFDSPVLVLARTEAEVPLVQRVLAERRARYEVPPFGEARALLDLVPADQSTKVALLMALRADLLAARRSRAISDADWALLEPVLPPAGLTPFTVDDLPSDLLAGVGRGARARLVLLEPASAQVDDDARELARLAASVEDLRLPDGSTVRGTGRALLFARMLRLTFERLPLALLVSLGSTAVAVAASFRRGAGRARSAGLVLLALGIGVAGMALGTAVLGVRLDLFNVIAIPVAFGIGADYALNLTVRAADRGDATPLGDRLVTALDGVGGAIVLSSATTTLGYLALVRSVNPAIRGLGTLSVLGEAACLFGGLLAMPALVRVLDTRASERKTDLVP